MDIGQNHLRLANGNAATQSAALEAIVRASPLLMQALEGLRYLALPDDWLVAGAVYNTVWNALTRRDPLHGINDVDIFYFDGSDLSYEAEDDVIRAAEPVFEALPVRAEIRNQARVHLWFGDHYGSERAPLASCRESITQFSAITHSVAIRLTADGDIETFAPYGLDSIFSFRLAPNHRLDNRATYERKAARAKRLWPELDVEAW